MNPATEPAFRFRYFLRTNAIRLLGWIGWQCLIFILSHQDATQSGGLTAKLLSWLQSHGILNGSWISPETAFFLLRKSAHFTEYAILGLLTAQVGSRLPWSRSWVYPVAYCVAFAISDEVHQAFVPGRGPAVTDVIIDSAGALAGIMIYSVSLRYAGNHRHQRP